MEIMAAKVNLEKRPFLSIIVPVYNVEAYVGECLDSLLDQDIPEEEYEIICVNDGSTDGSLAVLTKYAETHSNIRIIDQPNGGVSIARNAGLDVALGKYIWFVDADDAIIKDSLSQLRNVISENHSNRIIVNSYVFSEKLPSKEHIVNLPIGGSHYDSVVWRNIFEQEFLKKHNLYFAYPGMIIAEDCMFIHDILAYQPTTSTYLTPVYCYRIRPGSVMTTHSAEVQLKKLKSYMEAAKTLHIHYTKNWGDRRNTANLLMQFIWNALFLIVQLPQKGRNAYLYEMKLSGLFPYHRPLECDINKSYQTTRADFVGKLFDKIYINMHHPLGFHLMCVWQTLTSLKNSVLHRQK